MSTRSLGVLTLDLIAKIGGYTGPLDKASKETQRTAKAITSSIKQITGAVIGVGSIAGFGLLIKQSIDLQDEIGKTSKKIGVSVEDLSSLRFTADLAGVSLEDLSGSLGKFNKNISDAYTTGVGDAADALDDLGVKITDNNGQLRKSLDIFSDVADQFQNLEDGALKTELAMSLFGKSGKDLIPLLNGGSEALREGSEEAKRLGQVFSTTGANSAEEFNDNLSRLKASITGIANAIANDALPDLEKMSSVFADPEFQQGVASIGSGLAYVARGAIQASSELFKLAKFNAEELAAQIGGISNDDIPRLTKRLTELNAQLDPKNFTDYFTNSEVSDVFSNTDSLEKERTRIKTIIKEWEKGSIAAIQAKNNARDSFFEDASYDFNSTDAEKEANRKKQEDEIKRRREARDVAEAAVKASAAAQKELDKQFESTRDGLQKEIDLYNKSSKAASIAYETTTGDLKGLTDARKQELDSLAKQLDLNEKNAVLLASQREVDLSAMGEKGALASVQLEYDLKNGIVKLNDKISEQDKERLIANAKEAESNETLNNVNEILKQQQRTIDLYGESTEAAKLEYDIRNGILKVEGGINSAQAQQLINNQKIIDSQENLKSLTQLTEEAVGRVDASWVSVLENLEDGFDGTREAIFKSFKKLLAEMAHQALTKPILLKFQQSVGGFLGGQSGSNSLNAGSQVSGYTGAAFSNFNSGNMGGSGGKSSGGASALSAVGAGGIYGAAALAVVAAVGIWNKKQDEKFVKLTAAYRQGTQSTGTLLGEANKKSASLANSISELSKYSGDSLNVNYNMLNQLIAIREGITGVASGFARQFGLKGVGDFSGVDTGTKTPGPGDSLKKVTSALFFDNIGGDFLAGFANGITDAISKNVYKESKKITDTGIKFIGESLSDVLVNGTVGALAYADVKSTKKLFGINVSSKLKTKTTPLDDVILSQFADVFGGAGEVLDQAADAFGLDFDKFIDKLLIAPQSLSLKGLEGDELTKEIEAFFSSTLDNWAGVLVDGTGVLEKFQKVGEGAFETVIRLASETNLFADYAEKLKLNFKAVGFEAVNITETLADLVGGFDNLSSFLSSYNEKFFTDSEKFATLQKSLGDAFAKSGATLPKTRAEFRKLIEGIDVSTEQGQKQFAALISLTNATDSYLTSLERETEAKKDGTSTLDDSAQAALDAAKAQKDALKEIAESAFDVFSKAIEADMEKVNKALSESRQVSDSLTNALKNMRLESVKMDVINRKQAQARLITANAISKAGGPLPKSSEIDDILNALSQPSQQMFSTFEEYARDFYVTQKNIKELSEAAGGRVSIDEQNLKALQDSLDYYQKQIDILNGIDVSVVSVSTAISRLTTALLNAGVEGVVAKEVPAISDYYEKTQSTQSNQVASVNSTIDTFANQTYYGLLEQIQVLSENLQSSQFAIAKNTLKQSKVIERWDTDGMPPVRDGELT